PPARPAPPRPPRRARGPARRSSTRAASTALRGSPRPARCALQVGDHRTLLRRAGLALARCGRRRLGPRRACVDPGEAPVRPDVLAPADDAIGECRVRRAAGALADLRARSPLAAAVGPRAG